MSFGILTLATKRDYLKAIGLSLSLRISNPGVKVAIACPEDVRSLVDPYFDYVVNQDLTFKGFEQKVNLDRYSPFDLTLFFDSDILVFRPVLPFVKHWTDGAYAACGSYLTEGISNFGMDVGKVRVLLGKDKLVRIQGAGHGLFRKPACFDFFEKARDVTKRYHEYVGDARYADEDAISIVMTMMDLAPVPYGEFFARYLSAIPGTMDMDAVNSRCYFLAQNSGKPFQPCIVHFASNEAPVAYTKQLFRLFKHFNVSTQGLLNLGLNSFYKRNIKDSLYRQKKRLGSL